MCVCRCVFVWVCDYSEASVMAVSIMSACCRASVLYLYLFACFLQAHGQRQGEIFDMLLFTFIIL